MKDRLPPRKGLYTLTKETAEHAGETDRLQGRPADPGRHGALPGSAWGLWYASGYDRKDEQLKPRP